MKHPMPKTRLTVCALLAALAFAACEPNEPQPSPSDTIVPESGMALVLNEGNWGSNNASLTRLDLAKGTIENNWFSTVNGRGLGDLAQDLVVYGSKAYITVSESGSMEVVDTATGLSTRVDLGTRYPRYIAADGGKLYVTCYRPRSIVRIDTATLQVEASCALGDYNPEGIAAVGGKLLVASSNISDAQGTYSYDNSLYVVDIESFSIDTTLAVGSNPQKVVAVDGSRAVVNYVGDYGSQPAGSALVDVGSLSVTPIGIELTNMTVGSGSTIYGYSTVWAADYSGKTTTFVSIDPASLTVTPILTGVNLNAYAIGVHPASGNIYVASDGDYIAAGDLYCFSPDGTRRWRREVGMLPSKIVFY